MNAQTKRDFAEFAEAVAWKFHGGSWHSTGMVWDQIAADYRNAVEELEPTEVWAPKFKPGDKVRYVKDKSKGGVVWDVHTDGLYKGAIALEGMEYWAPERIPHESELELGEPIVDKPVPLGPEDRMSNGHAVRTVAAVETDHVHYVLGGWDTLSQVERVGPPAEITPGRAVHVLDDEGKFLREAIIDEVGGTLYGYIYVDRVGLWQKGDCHRHNLRLAACLKSE